MESVPWDFPGGPVIKTLPFHLRGHGFDPWWGELRSCQRAAQPKKKKVFLKAVPGIQ